MTKIFSVYKVKIKNNQKSDKIQIIRDQISKCQNNNEIESLKALNKKIKKFDEFIITLDDDIHSESFYKSLEEIFLPEKIGEVHIPKVQMVSPRRKKKVNKSLEQHYLSNLGFTQLWIYEKIIRKHLIKRNPKFKFAFNRVHDLEYDFERNHIELTNNLIPNNKKDSKKKLIWHGTAVMSILYSIRNGLGIDGLLPNSRKIFHSVKLDRLNKWDNVIEVMLNSSKIESGDVILLEMEYRSGTRKTPIEMLPNLKKNIDKLVKAKNVYIVVPAGNSNLNLNHSPTIHINPSKAIYVGASNSPFMKNKQPYSKRNSSNYGDRVNLHAWGDHVAVACTKFSYTHYINNATETTCFNSNFNGTSASAAIIAGGISLLSTYASWFGKTIPSDKMLEVLKKTGDPQQFENDFEKPIGEQPNFARAFEYLVTNNHFGNDFKTYFESIF